MQMGNTGEGNQRRTILPALTSFFISLYLQLTLYPVYKYRIHFTINNLTVYPVHIQNTLYD